MRRFISSLTILAICALFSTAYAQEAGGPTTKDKKDKSAKLKDLAYKPTYSSNFQFGNPAYTRIVLEAWKAYENNNFNGAESFFADTVTFWLSDGTTLKGLTTAMDGIKAYRSSLTSMKCNIAGVTNLTAIEHPEEQVVCVWGDESFTKADGKSEKVYIHEIWFFNKDGKISGMRQYSSVPGK